MTSNPRPLAPHVQAAIAKGQGVAAQPKSERAPSTAAMAPHVRAAIAQATMAGLGRGLQPAPAPAAPAAIDLGEIGHVVADHTGRDDAWALAHGKGIFNPTFLQAFGGDAAAALAAIARDLLANGAHGAPAINADGERVIEYYRKYSDPGQVGVPTGWNLETEDRRAYKSGVTMRCRIDPGGLTLLTMYPAGAHPYRDP